MSGTFSCLISEAGTTSSLHLDFDSKNKGIEIFYHGYLFPNMKKLSNVYFMKLSLIHVCMMTCWVNNTIYRVTDTLNLPQT